MNAFRNILKRIFPTPFLKEAFLVYNRIRISTVDKLLFPEYRIPKHLFLLYRTGFPFRENKIQTADLRDSKVREYMQHWDRWTQEEFILILQTPHWIEPDYGWAVVSPNRLVYYSLGISRTVFQPKPGFLKLFRKREVVLLDRALSLRDTGEENYFHFFNDVLTKIYLLRQRRIDLANVPIIISKKLWDKPYFQYYLKYVQDFQSFQWVIQDQQYIHCQSAIFCKALTHREDLWRVLLAPLMKPGNGKRKIFITRSKSRLRFLENSKEIEAVCSRFGMEIVDADQLSMGEQIELFSNSILIAGIHGAGLTNLVFRNGSCEIVEIFSPPDLGYLPFHYIMLAKMRRFQYQAVIGEKGRLKYSGGFYLDPERWERQLSNRT